MQSLYICGISHQSHCSCYQQPFKSPLQTFIYGSLAKYKVKMAGYWANVCCCVSNASNVNVACFRHSVRGASKGKRRKQDNFHTTKRTTSISSYLYRAGLVNDGFIIWLYKTFSAADNPELALSCPHG